MAFKTHTPTGYTWCTLKDISNIRIDYIFINRNFIFDMNNIISRKISREKSWKKNVSPRSMKITFNIDVNKRGYGYWKFNISHLNYINNKNRN